MIYVYIIMNGIIWYIFSRGMYIYILRLSRARRTYCITHNKTKSQGFKHLREIVEITRNNIIDTYMCDPNLCFKISF